MIIIFCQYKAEQQPKINYQKKLIKPPSHRKKEKKKNSSYLTTSEERIDGDVNSS